MKPSPSLPSLGQLQLNVERLRKADNEAKREELRARAALTRATEKAISSRQALLNSVAELDEAASSLSRSARS